MQFLIFNKFSILQFSKYILFNLLPTTRIKVSGKSMEPALRDQQEVFFVKYWLGQPVLGDIVLCKDPKNGRLLIKRLIKQDDNHYWVVGDNAKESTDSRNFGWIERKDIIGKKI